MAYKLLDDLMEYRHELYFLELSKPLQLDDATLEAHIPLPVDYYRLKDQVVNSQEHDFTVLQFMEGMLKVLGMDKTFQYREKYRTFLENAPLALLEELFQLAIEYKSRGEFIHALLIFKGLLQLFETDEKVLYLYGCTALDYSMVSTDAEKKRHLEEVAKLIFEKMVKMDAGKPYACYQLGFIYSNSERYDEAYTAFQTALALVEDEAIRDDILEHLPALEDKQLYHRGLEWIEQEKWHEAIACFLPLTAKYDDWWQLFLALGTSYRHTQQLEDAHYYLRKARAFRGDEPEILGELGRLHWQWRHLKEAKDFYAKALAQLPEDLVLLEEFILLLRQLGEKELARKFLEQALVIVPDDEQFQQLLVDSL